MCIGIFVCIFVSIYACNWTERCIKCLSCDRKLFNFLLTFCGIHDFSFICMDVNACFLLDFYVIFLIASSSVIWHMHTHIIYTRVTMLKSNTKKVRKKGVFMKTAIIYRMNGKLKFFQQIFFEYFQNFVLLLIFFLILKKKIFIMNLQML